MLRLREMKSSLVVVVATLVMTAAVDGTVVGYSGKVLLVSMDGFRWDYIKKVSGLTHFPAMAASGVTVDYVNNTFITKTFPCHYSIATGLYEETHGIIANKMYDRTRNASFNMASKEPFWWDGGEPIWVTAEKNKRNSSAVYFWPGSEAKIRGYRPSIYKTYNSSVPYQERIDAVLKWFAEDNKDFVALYFDEPDTTGHKFGPDSNEVAQKVREMDGILGSILRGLDEKNLTNIVNVIVTSDHGMTEVDMDDKLINLWDHINSSLVQLVPDSGPVTAILPYSGQEAEVMIQAKTIEHVTPYMKADIPDHFHYKHNERIMPIIIISDEGWTLSSNVTSDRETNETGNHGYSNMLLSMKPIFFARGPDFRKGIKSTSISSLDIYPLMCRLLNINAAPNNGSLTNTEQFLVGYTTSASQVFGHCSWLILSLVVAVMFVC